MHEAGLMCSERLGEGIEARVGLEQGILGVAGALEMDQVPDQVRPLIVGFLLLEAQPTCVRDRCVLVEGRM